MACGGCRKRTNPVKSIVIANPKPFTVMGNYKYLNTSQISKRLEMFKEQHCSECNHKRSCTYETYQTCKKAAEIEAAS